MDQIAPNWKESFFQSEKSLFDILKVNIHKQSNFILEHISVSEETNNIVTYVLQNKEKQFQDYEHQTGYHIWIEGEIRANGFDPMNIITLKDRQLHQNFLKVLLGDQEYLIQKPVIAISDQDFTKITQLLFITNKQPIQTKDSLIIDGFGKIKGNYKKSENTFYLSI